MKQIRSNFVNESIAQESILFQSGIFFKELTLAFTELKAGDRKSIKDNDAVSTIAAVIKHNTNINAAFILDDYGPCVEVPVLDKNHPLINELVRNYVDSADGIKMINNAKDGLARGSVNLKTSKVTGIFTDAPTKIHFPVSMIVSSKFLPEELAAMMLHEVGHLFTYYEFISRTVRTNQVLAGLSKALDHSGTVEEREAILISVKTAMNLSELDTKKLSATNNNRVIEIVVVSNIVKTTESEIGTNIYDMNTWEYLCDEFATRHGAGRYLVTAFDKLFREFGHRSFRSLPGFLCYEAIKLLLLVTLFPLLGLILIVCDGNGDGTYDEPGARMKRVRNQIVQNLKDNKLTKDDQLRLIADLECIDKLLKNVNDRRQFFGMLWDVLSPSARRAYSQEKIQQELESIAINDLFVKSASLKQLS